MTVWTLLILSLPTENASARMRAWRALKAGGAAVLRDGVYLLPGGGARRGVFEAVAADVEASGGSAHVLDLAPDTDAPFAGLFDRTADYQRLATDITACRGDLDAVAAPDLARLARKLRKAFDAVAAIDFFPGQAQAQTAALLEALDDALRARLSPGEPSARAAAIERRLVADYADRLWATRRRPWVDRLASAWLIRRFIDVRARFLWLEQPADCPADALGFDFDGAAFSHVGERVTFETLLASFGLESDPTLTRIARIVHYLDVGGLPAPEAAGLETLFAGMRAAIADDDALLEAALAAFDFLHSALKEGP
ncbi:MAG: chromate resistance protein [Betaproteobacteria bacterium]|nr:chromate resistance protein [Betaproteobacteria bacterium]